jgi:3' terminal RNA ribose 2'-O-methyltransferase Hen1
VLFTLSTDHSPATDLGYLLHKHPDRCQQFKLSFGQASVFYPEANSDRCTCALLLDIDPVGLVRGGGSGIEQYVNDRPYVASSFMSVAIAQVFGSALAGHSRERPELVELALPLTARIGVLPCRGGESFLRRLFEPLGYTVQVSPIALDSQFPEWGASPYFSVELSGQVRLQQLLSHLYVLIPVLDDNKHYWVGKEEIDKLLNHGSEWLSQHPERQEITHRYLKRQRALTREALAQLVQVEDQPDSDSAQQSRTTEEMTLEKPLSLNEQRLQAVASVLLSSGAKRVVDLGCGEGKLLEFLLKHRQFEELLGMDVSWRSLEIAHERLHLDRMSEVQRGRIKLVQGSLTYRDERLSGFDAATVIEVIEHLDPHRLATFERILFECVGALTTVVTTPNIEYNCRFAGLPTGQLRHRDHRFEWSREQFQTWANQIAERYKLKVHFLGIGSEDPEVGTPTQMGVFTR